MKGALYDADGNLVGTMLLKFGRRSSKGMVKVSATATAMGGKKIQARAKNFELSGGRIAGRLDFKAPILAMDLKEGADGTFTLKSSAYRMKKSSVGGVLAPKSLMFNAAIDHVPDFGSAGKILEAALPTNVLIYVANGTRWSCGKAPSIKYKKNREAGKYELVGLGDPAKPNVSALKLTYAHKTGIYKGSFKLYATNAGSIPPNKAPKLKKYKVNVFGFVLGTEGDGLGTLKRPAATWRVWVK